MGATHPGWAIEERAGATSPMERASELRHTLGMAVTPGRADTVPGMFQPPQTREDLSGHRRVLVLVHGHLRDTMAATPALRSLRAALPGARVNVTPRTAARYARLLVETRLVGTLDSA